MINKITKQVDVGAWWGAFRNLAGYVSFYLMLANFFILLINTCILGNMAVYGLPIPIWLVILIVGVIFFVLLLLAMLFEHKYTLPTFMTYWNKQWWEHNNPMAEEVKTMREQLDRIELSLKEKQS